MDTISVSPPAGSYVDSFGNVFLPSSSLLISGNDLSNGAPVVGATVSVVDGTNKISQQTKTDGSGNWSISLDVSQIGSSGTLIFSDGNSNQVFEHISTSQFNGTPRIVEDRKYWYVSDPHQTINITPASAPGATEYLLDNGNVIATVTGIDRESPVEAVLSPGVNVLTVQETNFFGNSETSKPFTYIVASGTSIDWQNTKDEIGNFVGQVLGSDVPGAKNFLSSLKGFINSHFKLWSQIISATGNTHLAEDVIGKHFSSGESLNRLFSGAGRHDLQLGISNEANQIAQISGLPMNDNEILATAILTGGIAHDYDASTSLVKTNQMADKTLNNLNQLYSTLVPAHHS